MGKNPTEHSMLTRQTTQSRAIQKTKRVPRKMTNNKQASYKNSRGNKKRLSLQSSCFHDENNENFTANGLDYESIEFSDYDCGDEYTSSQSIIFSAWKLKILQ